MIIILLAATMTVAMLFATAVSLHQEAQRAKVSAAPRKQAVRRIPCKSW